MKIFKRITKRIKGEQGLTLMEVVVALVAVSIILIPVSKLINTTVVGYTKVRDYSMVIEHARIGLNIMMSEIRSIENQAAITSGSSTSITIDVPTSSRDVTYALNTDNEMITRKESGLFTSPYPFIMFVKDFDITYYDREDNSVAYDDANLWRIGIEVVIGDETAEYGLYDQVFPRQWLN